MGGTMMSKSLIQFFVDQWGCVPLMLLDLISNYGGGNEDDGGLLKNILCTQCHTQGPLTLQQATFDPHLCWSLVDTHRRVWVSLL